MDTLTSIESDIKAGVPANLSPNRRTVAEVMSVAEQLRQADEAGLVALTRHLCEQVLDVRPDHGPTLIRYAACLIELSLYEDATAAHC